MSSNINSKKKLPFPGPRSPNLYIEKVQKQALIPDGFKQDEKRKKNGIDVLCRIRPQFQQESFVPYKINPEFFQNEIELFETQQQKMNKVDLCNSKKFRFTKVFDQETNNQMLLDEYVSKIVQELLEQRKSGLVFSYGVTNSGKTYTIVGTDQDPGILPLTMNVMMNIQSTLRKGEQSFQFGDRSIQFQTLANYLLVDMECTLQSYEIYNEELYDLLIDRKINKERTRLYIKEIGERRVVVKDAFEMNIQREQISKILDLCLSNRQMGETILNIASSRSHTIFRLNVKLIYMNQQTKIQSVYESSLCIVDLAGSERSKKADTQGSQLNEACNINKSLLVLGRCLTLLRNHDQDSNSIVPFRECKLTRLLCEYFTEDNNILMIVNVKLSDDDLEETLKVLHYGAMGIQINLIKSKVLDSTLSFQSKLQLQQLVQKKPDPIKEEIPKPIQQIEAGSLLNDQYQYIRTVSIVENIKSNIEINQKLMQDDLNSQKLQVDDFREKLYNFKRSKQQTDPDHIPELKSYETLVQKISDVTTKNQLSQIQDKEQVPVEVKDEQDFEDIVEVNGQFFEEKQIIQDVPASNVDQVEQVVDNLQETPQQIEDLEVKGDLPITDIIELKEEQSIIKDEFKSEDVQEFEEKDDKKVFSQRQSHSNLVSVDYENLSSGQQNSNPTNQEKYFNNISGELMQTKFFSFGNQSFLNTLNSEIVGDEMNNQLLQLFNKQPVEENGQNFNTSKLESLDDTKCQKYVNKSTNTTPPNEVREIFNSLLDIQKECIEDRQDFKQKILDSLKLEVQQDLQKSFVKKENLPVNCKTNIQVILEHTELEEKKNIQKGGKKKKNNKKKRY